jgi:Flp pilus assembly pilin Flp
MLTTTYHVLRTRRVVTAIEYGIIASLVAPAIIGAIAVVGTDMYNTLSHIASVINHG